MILVKKDEITKKLLLLASNKKTNEEAKKLITIFEIAKERSAELEKLRQKELFDEERKEKSKCYTEVPLEFVLMYLDLINDWDCYDIHLWHKACVEAQLLSLKKNKR